jgi:hypothetical protein
VTEIINALIETIDPNPFRMLGEYPFIERKLDALQRSYADVGMWEGVIARRDGNRFQIAFGHHRVEAARRSGAATAPLIVRDLSDEQMLQFMGRENLEDYNTSFLTMLETWEAGIRFLVRSTERKSTQPIKIARLLGWTIFDADNNEELTHTAKACHAAFALIEAGHLSRSKLDDLTVKAAREIVERAHARVSQIDKMAKQTRRPAAETERAKNHVGRAAETVAEEYRQGKHSVDSLRGRVDAEAFATSQRDNKPTPLFAVFGRAVAEQIHKMLRHDVTAERLEQIANAISEITMEEDRETLEEIQYRLALHEQKTQQWRERLTPSGLKVVPLKALQDRRAS